MLNATWSEWFPPVNWIDLSLLLVFVLFGLRGYFRGLFREVFSLAGLVAGFMIAVRYNESMAALVSTYWAASPLLLKGVAFVAAFFLVYFVFNLFGWLLHRSEKLLLLHTVNRVGGVAIGLGKGAAIMAVIVTLFGSASWVPYPTRNKLGGAYLIAPLSRLGEGLFRLGKETLFPKTDEAVQFRQSVLSPSWRG
jgi:membrane protein required for colicin V production